MTPARCLRFRGRQELDAVLGGSADHLVGVGHLVELVEQLLETAGGRDPEQAARRLRGRVEVAVRYSARQLDQRARRRVVALPVELNFKFALENCDELVLCGMDMGWHEGAWRI